MENFNMKLGKTRMKCESICKICGAICRIHKKSDLCVLLDSEQQNNTKQ